MRAATPRSVPPGPGPRRCWPARAGAVPTGQHDEADDGDHAEEEPLDGVDEAGAGAQCGRGDRRDLPGVERRLLQPLEPHRGQVQAGMITGIVGTVFLVLGLLYLIFVLFIFGAAATSGGFR